MASKLKVYFGKGKHHKKNKGHTIKILEDIKDINNIAFRLASFFKCLPKSMY